MPRPRILVTGGAGYIGSHTAKTLAAAGYEPVVFDDLSTGNRHAVRWGPLVEASLAAPTAITAALRQFDPVAIIHFAAHAYVGESVVQPAKYYRNNVANTINLLDAARAHGDLPVVFSSTCATYGLPERLPIDESHPQRPINPYGQTKLIVEGMLAAYASAYGVRSVALRYFNAAGADPDGELGEEHEEETHLVPLALFAALGRRPPLDVFGSDYPTDDGTAIRDFVHVSDLASAHVLALEYLLDGGESTAVNLGIGRGFSVRETIAAVERVTGLPVPIVDRPRRPGDPHALIADPSRAQALLGWTPHHSEMDVIVGSAYAWYRQNRERASPVSQVDMSAQAAD
jgi:UDP-arabinose 4-epimerase